MPGKALVVDANILVRAVLGKRVREIIERYTGQASFFVPEVAYAEAEEHLPTLVIRRGGDPEKALAFFRSVGGLVDFDWERSLRWIRSRSPRASGASRSGRLADSGFRIGHRLPYLDGRH